MPFGIRFKKNGKKPEKESALASAEQKPAEKQAEIEEQEEEEHGEGEEAATEPKVLEKEIKPAVGKLEEPLEIKIVEGQEKKASRPMEFLPFRVSSFDDLIERHGAERGSTLLISGGCGTGKSTFCIQSVYNGLLKGEKAVYITFEESPEKIKRHMKENYGWNLEKFEKEKKFAMLKLNPFKIARSVEASLAQQRKALLIKVEQITLPFMPDRIVVDSLSALSIAFMGNVENYRYYVRHMFEILDNYNSVNFIVSETEQDPGVYSRTGMEEFLADAVLVLYNTKVGRTRERALEILKMRYSNHIKELVQYQLTTDRGMVIFRGSEVEQQLKEFSELGPSIEQELKELSTDLKSQGEFKEKKEKKGKG